MAIAFAAAFTASAGPADTAGRAGRAAGAAAGLAVPIPYYVPPGLAVPKTPDEKGRTVVADTLRFKWPPADSAAAKAASKSAADAAAATSKKIIIEDTADAASNITPIDSLSEKFTEDDAAEAESDTVAAARKSAEPPLKRPRTRQELNKMSREELFRLAFGRGAPDKPRNLAVRLFGEGRPIGNTEIAYNGDFTAFTFRSTALSRLLDKLILPEARDAAGDSLGHFDSAIMEAAGYSLTVDDANFELRVAFPPEDKDVQFTRVYGDRWTDEPRGDEIPPAAFSLYINYNVDDRGRYLRYGGGVPAYDWAPYAGDTLIREAAVVNVDGAAAFGGWVFESSGWIREPPYRGGLTFEWDTLRWEHARRDDARAVRNFEKLRSQLFIGDITAGTSFLPGPISGGARYERNSYFFGNDPRDNLNSVSFFMAAPGEVEVYMDGAFKRRIRLPAGRHRLGGFGGNVGRNRVRLLLRSAGGSTEEIPFEFVLSHPQIMARGDSRYALTAGVRREYAPSPACFYYYADEPVVSADYAYGIHHAANAGVSAVAARRAGLGGAQISFVLGDFGFVDLRGIASYRVEDVIGAAGGETAKNIVGQRAEGSYTANLERPVARLNRLLTGDPNKAFLPEMSFAARGYWQSEFYTTRMFKEPFIGVEGGAGGVSGNLAMALWRGSLSAFGGMNFYRNTVFAADSRPYDYDYGVRLAQGFGRSYFSASAGESVRGSVRSPYVAMNTSHSFGADVSVRNHRFSAAVNAGMNSTYAKNIDEGSENPAGYAPEEPMELDWSYGGMAGWEWSNGASGVGLREYAANATLVNDRPLTAAAALRHIYNRAQLNAYYDLGFDDDAYDRETHAFRAQLAGSFMFADGLWALGQRVSDGGFALIDAHGDMRGAKVHVNRSRSSGDALSRSGLLGAAYHNRLTAYAPTEMTLSLTGAPAGAFLEQSRYYASGTYKQGFALKIGKRSRVIVSALLVEKRGGKPLGHTYLTIVQEPDSAYAAQNGEDAAAPPRAAFTGENGVLQIGGLTPGRRYRIKFRASSHLRDAIIEIPEDAYGIYSHPEVTVERDD